MMKGCFITIDGIDGAGSSTQTKLLVDKLIELGYNSVGTKEPNPNGPIEPIIRSIIKGPCISPELEALLFAADRIYHVEFFIKPWLKEGKIVVSDRYLESSIAYQTSQGLDEDWILLINKKAIIPDISIILDVDPEISLKRKTILIDRYERIEFLKKVRLKFLERAKKMNYYIIDASKSIIEIHKEILDLVLDYINKKS
ncbi:MAG: dTMP kinase [Candidatus Methanomethylicota archaeon]|uniref:Probable thymidylate kinase n=1 Tax=Thermoproteota archaeon TaxID=2056631 RepID=A0A520KGT7_9CREN|nr:MAG: dTMP kinase [Candidatus Verstraetearchaeota archaeon]TDA38523.1 MAG: dTMP kinase [Candidatus Verstraetearchaeota archaeon]